VVVEGRHFATRACHAREPRDQDETLLQLVPPGACIRITICGDDGTPLAERTWRSKCQFRFERIRVIVPRCGSAIGKGGKRARNHRVESVILEALRLGRVQCLFLLQPRDQRRLHRHLRAHDRRHPAALRTQQLHAAGHVIGAATAEELRQRRVEERGHKVRQPLRQRNIGLDDRARDARSPTPLGHVRAVACGAAGRAALRARRRSAEEGLHEVELRGADLVGSSGEQERQAELRSH
jgi:hypothetical protein